MFSEMLRSVGCNRLDGAGKKDGFKVHAMMDAFSDLFFEIKITSFERKRMSKPNSSADLSQHADADGKQEFSGTGLELNEFDFKLLFTDNFRGLCAYCCTRFSFDADTAKDIVHNGFLKLWEHRSRLKTTQALKSYLFKLVNGLALDMIRHRKVEKKYQQYVIRNSDVRTEELPPATNSALESELEKAINEMPDRMRKIFVLIKIDGLKYAEAAHRLNISVKTVEMQMHRAMIKLRTKLSHYLGSNLLLIIACELF